MEEKFNPFKKALEDSQNLLDNEQQYSENKSGKPFDVRKENITKEQSYSENNKSRTYSDDELRNEKTITVTIEDTKTPILVLFGPPAVGKTMTLIRLAQYLNDNHLTIKPVRSFRPSYDVNYKEKCDNFNSLLYDKYAAEKTGGINFMLLKIFHYNKPIIQILEAPGEHYYDPYSEEKEPKTQFLPFIQKIINSPNRKIWVYLVEPEWTIPHDPKRTPIPLDMNLVKNSYSQKVSNMKRLINSRDKSIILFNKVDNMQEAFNEHGVIDLDSIANYIKGAYELIMESFINTNPITSMWKKYNCTIIPFQTGTYEEALVGNDPKKTYTKGKDEYPAMLFKCIRKIIKG